MRTVLLLLRKDLLRRRRSPLGVLIMLAFPLIFAAMLSLAFGGSDTGIPAAKLLVHDQDGAFVGGLIQSFLAADPLTDYLTVVSVGEEGTQMMEDGDASALLRIPPETTLKLFEGEAVTFELVRNPTQGILPEIAEQITATMVDMLSVGARVIRREATALDIDLENFDNIDDGLFAKLAVRLRRLADVGGDYIDDPPLSLEVVELGGEAAEDTPGGEDDSDDDADDDGRLAIFLFVLPGIAVYSLFIIGDQMMRDILAEGQAGTLRRQMSAPIQVRHVVAGKVLLSGLVAGLALLILATIVVFLAKATVNLLGFAALSLALLLAISGFAASIYGIAANERQGSTASSLIYLVMAFAGGSFLPLDNLPEAVQNVAHFSPFYWGTRGFQDLLAGGGLADVGQGVMILAGLGILFLAVGSWTLQRKVLRGNL